MKETQIQRYIESMVTQGRGYDRCNTTRTHDYIKNSEIGLQITLLNMDRIDKKLSFGDLLLFGSQFIKILKTFNDAEIPFEVITTAEGFKRAYESMSIDKKVLFRIRDDYVKDINPIPYDWSDSYKRFCFDRD
jgi:hypothetical protein